jgi:hypothetical protein
MAKKKKTEGEEEESPEAKKDKGRTSKIMSCTCQHPSQDALHGGKRVHNRQGGKENKGWRCTVCGTVKS